MTLNKAAPKSALASKTVWGGAIAVLAAVAGLLGYQVTEADQADIVKYASDAVVIIGGLIAVYGRITAKRTIGKP